MKNGAEARAKPETVDVKRRFSDDNCDEFGFGPRKTDKKRSLGFDRKQVHEVGNQ